MAQPFDVDNVQADDDAGNVDRGNGEVIEEIQQHNLDKQFVVSSVEPFEDVDNSDVRPY